jgi:hypothetical protein
MPSGNYLPEVLETTEAERIATGFIFTEGPTWHPDGYWYFFDLRQNKLFRLTPGKAPELIRTTIAGPEGDNNLWDSARVYRLAPNGGLSVLAHCEYPNEWARAVPRRTHYVRRKHPLIPIHPRDKARCGRQYGRT